MEWHDMTLTINNRLDGMALFIPSIFLLPLCPGFEKRLTVLSLPLLPPSRNLREAY
jgi:hypothetical protein